PQTTLSHSFPTRRSSDLLHGPVPGVLAEFAVKSGVFRRFYSRPEAATPGGVAKRAFHGAHEAGTDAEVEPVLTTAKYIEAVTDRDRKSTRLNSSHLVISY